MERDYQSFKNLERGIYYHKKIYDGCAPLQYEEVENKLPAPVLEARPQWVECYSYAVKSLFRHIHVPEPGSGFVSNFVDAAFNEDVFLSDTALMSVFCNLLHPYVPGICSLDNFYCKQFEDGEIPRELVRATGEDFLPWVNVFHSALYSYFHNHYGFRMLRELGKLPFEEMYKPNMGRIIEQPPYLTLDNLNRPAAAFAELLSYWHTRDLERLQEVLEPLYKYYEAMYYHIRHQSGLFVTDWASMDNSPRNKHLGLAVDTSSEMLLFADNIIEIMEILKQEGCMVTDYKERREQLELQKRQLCECINHFMWNAEDGFYYDLTFGMKQTGIKTVAGFYPLTAGAADPVQAERLAAWLEDERTFKRAHRCPSLAADEPGYEPDGGYWKGAVWASANFFVTSGLERYGYQKLAKEIALNHLDAVAKVWKETGTIWENYSPDHITSGDSDHKDFVGISGIGPVLYLIQYGVGLSVEHKKELTVKWKVDKELVEAGKVGCRRYWFAGKEADFLAERTADGVKISVQTKDRFWLDVEYRGLKKRYWIDGDVVLREKSSRN